MCNVHKEMTMRGLGLSLLVTVGLASRGAAEERVHVLPEIIVGGGAGKTVDKPAMAGGGGRRATGKPDDCAGREPGSGPAMECLSQQLRKQVDRVNPTLNLPPLDARSPDAKVGVINIPGIQQQYGRNFGVSAVPFRPPAPVFMSPIAPHR
jgi:hypothetical protein